MSTGNEMSISGFSMVRNATLLYYPIREAIASILPLVDEFVVAVGQGDPGDRTLEEIQSLDSDKIRIIQTVWDIEAYPNGTENAHQTDLARAACTGDWLFYLQADEVVHEDDLHNIRMRCQELLNDTEVEGLLFRYLHFWGDYHHVHRAHGWYPHEIRIIRNDPDIHSWESAQSFRRIPGFDGRNYRQQEGTYKLNVAPVDARIFHYGWVRPPQLMDRKKHALQTIHKGRAWGESHMAEIQGFDYGPLNRVPRYEGTHPSVMQDWMARFDWQDQLYENGPLRSQRPLFKHERLKYRILSWLEQQLLGGRQLGGFRNYVRLKR